MNQTPGENHQSTLIFAHSLEEAAWHFATSGVQTIDDICLLQIDGQPRFTCFLTGSQKLDTDRYQAAKANPEQFYKDVKAGLKQLSTSLNQALAAEVRCSALNRERAHV